MNASNEDINNIEEPIIENRYNVTKELYARWAKENKVNRYFKIFWICCAIFSIVFAIICIISNYIVYGGILILYTIYSFYRGVVRNKLLVTEEYKARERIFKKSNWERKILFFNDYIETSDANMNILKFQYSDITNIKKNDECIKLKINNGGYIRIYKDAFTKSNFEECQKFISKKCDFI